MSGPTPPASTPTPPVLALVDATIPSLQDRFDTVLEHVNWEVRQGDFWAIGGLARSGKTDLMNVASGILRPRRGQFHLFGHEYSSGFEDEQISVRLKVGMVFDGGQLLQHLSLADNVALPLNYHAVESTTGEEVGTRADELLQFTNLVDRAGMLPSRVTRSAQQRAGLARALALNPEILLLDNPLSGLDPLDAAWWLETLDKLAAGHPIAQGRPLTIAVTGDDLSLWLSSRARQFAILKKDTFIPVGGRDELTRHPEPLLRDLLRSRPMDP